MRSLSVLLAEDEAVIGMLLAQLLEDMGHDVCAIATTEGEAVALAAKHSPDLLIVDGGLRGGSGVSAVASILRGGFVPHIFISGDLGSIRGLRSDAIVLEKPFVEAALALAIEQAVRADVSPE